MKTTLTSIDTRRLLRVAFALSVITIVYNIAEGAVSTFFGFSDDTLALFGFGIDSFVEVVSGVGIGHMSWRMLRNPVSERDRFERHALRITAASFFILAAGLVTASIVSAAYRIEPDTTLPGVVISVISIASMWALYAGKMKVGRRLDSAPIIADARCTKTCFYLSFILLASSGLYELFRINFIDIAGALGIAWFAIREGREALEKARSGSISCSCEGCGNDESGVT
ncbi:MAG: cation transporter [Spirochaetes bacterium]|nr:cation transporter [Spirochaetota bacterium]